MEAERAMRGGPTIWQIWYAWYPVLPVDDGIHWLEPVWRRRHPVSGRWHYQSFRSDFEKDREASNRAI